MSDDPITRRQLALDRFWDGLSRRGRSTPPRDPDLDPVLAETIRRLHALDAVPAEDPAFDARLREEFMDGYANAGTLPLRPVLPGTNGRRNGHAPTRLHPALPGRRQHRRLSAALSLLITLGIIGLTIGLIFTLYSQNRQATPPPGPASPTSIVAPTLDAGWPTIGGNAARTGATADAGPTGEIGALWTFQAPGRFKSPVAAGDAVFAFSTTGVLYALDAATGAQRWAYATGAVSTDTEHFPTPAVANGLVYVLAGDGFLYAVAADSGVLVWKVDLQATGEAGITSSVIDGGTLYVGSGSGKLFALDAATGEQRWTQSLGLGSVLGGVSVANGVAYFGDNVGGLDAFDAATGERLWEKRIAMAQRLPVADGTLYFATQDGLLHALDTASGEQRWLYLADDIVPLHEPAVANGIVVTAVDGTALVALDAASGDVVWTADVRPATAPVIAAGVVYAIENSGTLVALDLATGNEVGRGSALFGVVSPPAVASGVLYLATSNGTVGAYVTGPVETTVSEATPPAAAASPVP